MKAPTQVTAKQMIKAIELNPSWALSLTQPIEVIDFVNLSKSKITHLSEHISFKGKSKNGYCAVFQQCPNLQVALGQFYGGVDFSSSNLKELPNDPKLFSIHGYAHSGLSANFSACPKLEIATGTYPGAVNFATSGIKHIQELIVLGNTNPKSPEVVRKYCALFLGCKNLTQARGEFEGLVDFSGSGIESIDTENLKINKCNADRVSALFNHCVNLQVGEGNFPGLVSFQGSAIQSVKNINIQGSTKHGEEIKLYILGCRNLKSLPDNIKLSEIQGDPWLINSLKVKGKLLNDKNILEI